MIRDLGNRIVRETDPRIVTRRRARADQTGCTTPTRRQSCSLWPRVVWASCRSCRLVYRHSPRGGSCQSSHDAHYCATQKARAAMRERGE